MSMPTAALQQTPLGAYVKATVQEHAVGATGGEFRVQINSFTDVFCVFPFSICFFLFRFPDVLDIRRDSPTACREAIDVLLAISATKGTREVGFC